jgi:hypothetical protein
MVRVPEIKEMDDLGRGSLVIDGDGLREGWWFIEQVVTQFPLGSIMTTLDCSDILSLEFF